MQSSPASHHFLSLRSKYSPQHPVLKCPQSKFFLSCEGPSFTPMQKTSEVIVLYILIFKFLERRQ